MYIIFGAILFAIAYYFSNIIRNIFTTTVTDSKTISRQGFIWFGSILMINLIVLVFIVWYYYYIRDKPGAVGKQGFPGLPGNNAKDCKTC
jgi:glucan phosphoethanolaminetransferase (alkaline phosphatase superfamily)